MQPVTEDFLKTLVQGSRVFKFKKHPGKHGNDYTLYTVTRVISEHEVELMNAFDTGEKTKTMDFARMIHEAKWWTDPSADVPGSPQN